jgi:hypothetical protein
MIRMLSLVFLRRHNVAVSVDYEIRFHRLLDEISRAKIQLDDSEAAARWLCPVLCRNRREEGGSSGSRSRF